MNNQPNNDLKLQTSCVFEIKKKQNVKNIINKSIKMFAKQVNKNSTK